MGINQIEQTVINLLANELFHAGRKIPKEIDWNEVYQECKKQTVTLHCWKQVKQNSWILGSIYKEWERFAIGVAYSNLRVAWEHNNLDLMMRKEGIPCIILKGCASSFWYPDPLDRCLGDVDFIVPESERERAGQVLIKNGYQPGAVKNFYHIVYQKASSHLELHLEVPGIPYGKQGEYTRTYLKDIIEQKKEISFENGVICVPSIFHHGLILLLHTCHHLLGEGIGLRHLCDWAVFVSSINSPKFQTIFEEKLKNIGLWRFAQILTWTAERWLGCPHMAWSGEPDAKLADELIGEIFESGNFGQKQMGRAYEGYLISSRGKNGVGQISMLRQVIISMNELVSLHWPDAKKMPFIFPVGWIIFGIRYLFRIARGRNTPFQPVNLVQNAARRKKLYKKFHLFEI